MIKRGQIPKRDISPLLRSVDCFEENIAGDRSQLSNEFQLWLTTEIAAFRDRIRDQDYRFALDAQAAHLASTFNRMKSGEIKGITEFGGFKL